MELREDKSLDVIFVEAAKSINSRFMLGIFLIWANKKYLLKYLQNIKFI